MKTQTLYPVCLVDDDKKFLTSFQPARKHRLYVDTSKATSPDNGTKGITVFLVDDDILYLTAMEHFLTEQIPFIKIKTFQTGESSLMEMEQHPDIVILDYYLDSEVSSAENGLKILKKIKKIYPDTEVIMLSGQDQIKVAMNSIKHGAFDYVAKNENSFVKIKNILMNMAGNLNIVGRIKKHMKLFKIANIILLVMLLLFFILSNSK